MYTKLVKTAVHPENGQRIGLFEVRGDEVITFCKCCIFRRNCCPDLEEKNYYNDFPCGLLKPTVWLYIDEIDKPQKYPFKYGK